MNNSVFGAPGVFGGPSIFGAHELDPMFAASNPAHASVFGNMMATTSSTGGHSLGLVASHAGTALPNGNARAAISISRTKAQIKRLESKVANLKWKRANASLSKKKMDRIEAKIRIGERRINDLRAKLVELMAAQAQSNPKVVDKVKFGGGRRSDARDLYAEKAVDAWKRGDFAAARKYMKSYDNQKGTRLGLQRKAREHLNNPARESQFIDWVKRNYGVLGSEKTNKILGIEQSKDVGSGRRKVSKKKLAKIAVAVEEVAPPSEMTPGLAHPAIIRTRLTRSTGSTMQNMVRDASVGGPRVAKLLALPPHLRAARLSKMAGPMQRVRQRRAGGMAFLPFRQAIPQLKGLPRDQYRIKRNQMLVDRTVEQVLERLKADPNFINMSYEDKVEAVLPLAQAVDSEIAAVEVASDIQPPLPQEEAIAIEEVAEEADEAANWEEELLDEDMDLDSDAADLAGVFGSFGADTDVATRVEAAAQAVVDALEADVAATTATAEAVVKDEEEDNTAKYLMYAGAAALAYMLFIRR